MWSRSSAALLLSIAVLAACSRPSHDADTQAIQKVLDLRVQAINGKNLDLYASLIAADYHSAGVDRAQIVQSMARYFERFDQIRLESSVREIEHRRGRARVSQNLELKVSGLAQPMQDAETLVLEKIDGEWVITGGL